MESVFHTYRSSLFKDSVVHTIDHTTPGTYVIGKSGLVLVSKPKKKQEKKQEKRPKTPPLTRIQREVTTPEKMSQPALSRRPNKKRKRQIEEKEDSLREIDLHCYENFGEIMEDMDMEKKLETLTVLREEPIWMREDSYRDVCRTGIQLSPSNNSGDVYPSFKDWGTEQSPFKCSISQLY